MPRTLPTLGFLTLCLAAGCGGSGGGGGSPVKGPPVLLAASLADSGNNAPDSGEILELFLDEDVVLVAGAMLTDADFVLSAGTLGAVTAAPVLVGTRRVHLTLGAGVSFTPGVTTIACAAMGQDAIRSATSNKLAAGGNAVTFRIGDGTVPVAANLTLNGIPDELNGRGPAGGVLLVPRNGFTIQFDATDASNNLDASAFQITADKSVVVDAANVLPGVNLAPWLTAQAPAGSTRSYLVPANLVFPTGPVILTVVVFDTTSEGSTPIRFPFQTATADDGMRPFETAVNSRQNWFMDLSRDLESITSNAGATITFTYADGANGVPDLEEVLRIVGLQSVAPIPNVSGSRDSDDVAMDILKDEMLAQLPLLFPGVNVQYSFTNPGSFPAMLQPNYAQAGFSRICVAGRSSVSGALGVALFDTRNVHQDDDCAHPASNPSYSLRLGVFLETIVTHPSAGINGPAGTVFRNTFDPFIRHRGTPIGGDAADGTRLVNIENGAAGGDLRQTRMQTALVRVARFLAVVVAHETGHSMGLVKDGAPPAGFYGGSASFPGSTPGHIELESTGLFPAGAQEVMAPGISFDEALSPSTAFNALELAYLRERSFCNGN